MCFRTVVRLSEISRTTAPPRKEASKVNISQNIAGKAHNLLRSLAFHNVKMYPTRGTNRSTLARLRMTQAVLYNPRESRKVVAPNKDAFPLVKDINMSKSESLLELVTPSPESTSSRRPSLRSLGQSWMSQVNRDMAGGSSPHKDTVLTMLKRAMGRGGSKCSRTEKVAYNNSHRGGMALKSGS
ncbi:hypothetical protein MTO96_034395 [Rhipicephalus appendiculatus]